MKILTVNDFGGNVTIEQQREEQDYISKILEMVIRHMQTKEYEECEVYLNDNKGIQMRRFIAVSDKDAGEKRGADFPPRKLVFGDFSRLVQFCSLLGERAHLYSTLYKADEEYVLLVDFSQCESDAQAVAFMITAEEYGGKAGELGFEEAYLEEHGRRMIDGNAIEVLSAMS